MNKQLAAFIESHPEFIIESMNAYEGFKPGSREWANSEVDGIEANLSFMATLYSR